MNSTELNFFLELRFHGPLTWVSGPALLLDLYQTSGGSIPLV